MSLQSHLPVELYQPIIAHITDRRDLLSLVLASKILNQEAKPFLYRNLDLILEPFKHRSHKLLLDRLGNSPSLAGYVHSLAMSIDAFAFSSARRTLQVLRNLKMLRIYPTHSACISQLIDRPPFQLHLLSCSVRFDDAFKAFLRAQPEISTLILIEKAEPPMGYLSQQDLPSLKVLSSNPYFLADLLPGSNITCLNCVGNEHLLHFLLPKGLVINTLRSFKGFDREFLDLFSKMFPNLRFLEGFMDVFYDLCSSFNQFQHLEKLKIHYKYWPRANHETCSTFTTHIFDSCNTVDAIDIFQTSACWKVARGQFGTYSYMEMDSRRDEWMEWRT